MSVVEYFKLHPWMLPATYLVLINLVTFVIFGVDKARARSHSFRVPERTLILLAVFGGSVGAICGMRAFRHKTLHRKFTVGLPLILICQLAAAGYIIYRLYYAQ